MSNLPDSPWECLGCQISIDATNGIALADDGEYVVCDACWHHIPPALRLEYARKWRMDKLLRRTLESVISALESDSGPPWSFGGRN
jgi:hypothetical protein